MSIWFIGQLVRVWTGVQRVFPQQVPCRGYCMQNTCGNVQYERLWCQLPLPSAAIWRCKGILINDFEYCPFIIRNIQISGFDRFAGVEGLRGCCNVRSVTLDRFPGIRTTIPPPLQYPVKVCALMLLLHHVKYWQITYPIENYLKFWFAVCLDIWTYDMFSGIRIWVLQRAHHHVLRERVTAALWRPDYIDQSKPAEEVVVAIILTLNILCVAGMFKHYNNRNNTCGNVWYQLLKRINQRLDKGYILIGRTPRIKGP